MSEDETAQEIEATEKVEEVKDATEETREVAKEKKDIAEEKKEEPAAEPKRDENTVFIGKKGVMGYVLAVVTQFNNGAESVVLKARGKLISRAVDVAEIVRNRFLPEVSLTEITIKTEELASEDGSMSKVSAIEITLTK